MWSQHIIKLSSRKRGYHLITQDILKYIQSDINHIDIGLVNLFIQHTSASLTINENCDINVRKDMEDILNNIVPESNNYRHNDEGLDDMPAHVKASLFSTSINIPITKGKLNLGTWQGVWLNEHRNDGGSRTIVATIQGQSKSSGTNNNNNSDSKSN